MFPEFEARLCGAHVLEQAEEELPRGVLPGAGAEAPQPVTTLSISVPLLKNRHPNLNLRGLSSPIPGLAVRDSETERRGNVGGQETTPNHFLCPSAISPEILRSTRIEHLLCATLRARWGSAVTQTGIHPALVPRPNAGCHKRKSRGGASNPDPGVRISYRKN